MIIMKDIKHIKEIKFYVKGELCPNCWRLIRKGLARVQGVVRSAVADHEDQELRIVFDSKRTSQEALRSSIEQTGYEVSGGAELIRERRTPSVRRRVLH